MDIFILDVLLRPIDVVDEYISFLWTERWNSMGDFQITTLATPNNKRRFVPQTKLSITQSKRVMIIESVEEKDDIENGNVLTVKGRCLNSMLEKRVAAIHDSGLIATSWDTVGPTPKELLELYFFQICYTGEISSGDIIPFVQAQGTTSLYPAENIADPWPSDFQWSTKPEDLYKALQDICSAYDVGFRFYKSPTDSKLYFESMMGSDRTTQQSLYPPVIFSYDMVNLIDTTNLVDTTKYYNAVLVVYFYKDTSDVDTTISVWVESDDLTLSERGFDQKTKFLSVTQIPEGTALVDVPAYLTQLGQEELGRSQSVNVYDGEISKTASYVYEVDYNLGDLVEVRGNDGGTAYMRVVEQIFSSDGSGDSVFPSLMTKSFINPGTWASWKYNIPWADMGSSEYWSNQ
jgi:Siphovirus ReqiPepy6 Gp37-like protein